MLGEELLSSGNHLHKRTKKLDCATKNTALATAPHSERCLLTNFDEPVDICHLIAASTKSTVLRKLEYAWGLPHGQFPLSDIRHNVFSLRVDWCRLFDQNRWMLVPEYEVLETLYKVTVTEPPKDRFQINLRERFSSGTYKYNLVPLRKLQTAICRSDNPQADGFEKHTVHYYPYKTLGPLSSHIKPQYVVFNSGEKLQLFSYGELRLAEVFDQDILPSLLTIMKIYQHWTTSAIPDDPDSPCSRNEDDVQSTPTSESMESTSSCVDNSRNSFEEASWIAGISGCAQQCAEVASNGGQLLYPSAAAAAGLRN